MRSIPAEYIYFEKKCAMTGSVDNLRRIRLIEARVADDDARKVSRMEWAWGLPRGGLTYYIASPPNDIFLRSDISRLYSCGEFVLFPTFRTYTNAMEFMTRAGVTGRDLSDTSPRRPLTALCPPGELYRYVYIPLTDAAQKLQNELSLASQTEDDWNGGIHPATGELMDDWVKDLRVVETHTHPVSICLFTQEMLGRVRYLGTLLTPWKHCLWRFIQKWGLERGRYGLEPPEWFIDADEKNWDDENLCGSEASGYLPFSPDEDEGDCEQDRAPRYASSADTDDSQSSARVLGWLSHVQRPSRVSARPSKIPRHKALLARSNESHPLKQRTPAVHVSTQPAPIVRTSRKPQAPKVAPLGCPSKVSAPPNVPSLARTPKLTRAQRLASTAAPLSGNVPSPCRRLDKSMLERPSPRKALPAWVKQEGHFPSHTFSSNDWALFCYGVPLGPTFPDPNDE